MLPASKYGVHTSHCCVDRCKYGEDDCPVATGELPPEHPCEDCCCELFHPDLEKTADEWWNSLDGDKKRSIYYWEVMDSWVKQYDVDDEAKSKVVCKSRGHRTDPGCGAIITYTVADIATDDGATWLTCPNCNRVIYVFDVRRQ